MAKTPSKPETPPAKAPKKASRATSQQAPASEDVDNVLVRELHEEIQRDKVMGVLKRFQTPVLVLVVALIIGTAGYEGYKAWKRSGQAEETARYSEAMILIANNDHAKAVEILAGLFESGRFGVSKLGGLALADAWIQQKDEAKAKDILAKLADDRGAPETVRQSAALRLSAMEIRAGQTEAALKRLDSLTGEKDVFPHSARELKVDALLRQGKRDEALKELETLATVVQPRSIGNRASEVMVHVRREQP